MRIQRLLVVLVVIGLLTSIPAAAQCAKANRTVSAEVVAFDQLIMLNRRGASIPEGMIFALKSDVVALDGSSTPSAGNAMLRGDKRPRPIVLRVNQYDCLSITFTNWLSPKPVNNGTNANTLQTATRNASLHVNGMQLSQISDDGSFVGENPTSLVAPGSMTKYNLYATEQGTFLLYSLGAVFGGSGTPNGGAQQTEGLFGAVHVEPPDAEWYRSQVTEEDLRMASNGQLPSKHPKINYGATYPPGNLRAGKPILRMYTTDAADKNRTLVYSDLTAVITGKNHGSFNPNLFPSNDPNGPKAGTGTNPNFSLNYAEPNRTRPYREFTILYHELMEVTQALTTYYTTQSSNITPLGNTPGGLLTPVEDQFAINYGTGGIGTEILANRIGIGPEGGCPDCKYEEFFLDSWTVGDPSMIVDTAANAPCQPWTLYSIANNNSTAGAPPTCTTTTGAIDANNIMVPLRKANYALYPDDPSNVYHSYLNDHVKFRILHAGTGFSHVHHQHAHQWLRTPNNNESTYLDSQLINPGSAYTLEITFGGSGNRNHTPGDSIFHCHFYPHFAGGMWSLWRVHDTFEPGTKMDGNLPATGYARALPDAEILRGTPTPAIVPMPTIAMAPMPADVRLVEVVNPDAASPLTIGTTVQVKPEDLAAKKNPGYPFFIPGIAGVRAPHPPMDFAVDKGKTLDGGLPRHLLISGTVNATQMASNIYDFSKDLGNINAFQLPENGTDVEQVAMAFHEQCNHSSFTPAGTPKLFETNGLPPAPGAPYADPALLPFNPNDPPKGKARCKPVPPCPPGTPIDQCQWKRYKAAVFQTDLVFNKQGWHYPQARMLSLWQDVMPTLTGDRPPEPLFFRVQSDDATEYWHTNLVPDYYQLDDYQVRTPTDIIGQHIHLVKFDVTASDGASNGWNYEDGTFSPNEVQARMKSIANCSGLLPALPPLPADGSPLTPPACKSPGRTQLGQPQPPPADICGNRCPADWYGAQTTVQRWMADPLKSPAEDPKIDRTLRTVFTHDHFGPSTHQQTGLYAAFVIEPPHTEWFQSETNEKMYTRTDGGPTSWQAIVVPVKGQPSTDANTFREFAIALQDFQLTYGRDSRTKPDPLKISDPLDCNPFATTPTFKCGWADPLHVINQSNGVAIDPTASKATLYQNMSQQTVSAGPTQGTYTFNYRNEPLPYRLEKKPSGNPKDPRAIDPAWVFASNVERVNPTANPQPIPGRAINCPPPPALCPVQADAFTFPKKALTFDMRNGDPYTPMLRVYEKDNVQVRVIVGAHMLPHPFTIQGIKWHFEPGDSLVVAGKSTPAKNAKGLAVQPLKDINIVSAFDMSAKSQDNSGFKSTQAMGISEHFEFLFRVPRSKPQSIGFTDFLYMPDSANPPTPSGGNAGRGIVDGMWGIMRSYQVMQPKDKPLQPLPNNIPPTTPPPAQTAVATSEKPWWWATACTLSNTKTFSISTLNATITFNSRSASGSNPITPIQLTNALVYHDDNAPGITPGSEPLILHANAGDCLQVTLNNTFDTTNAAFTTQNLTYPSISVFNLYLTATGGNTVNPIYATNPSQQAGLNPALLSYDVATSSGTNIGFNLTPATAGPGNSKIYYWYAGHIAPDGKGTPIEFGAVNLTPADPVQQDTYGLVGGLIIEPKGTVFCADTTSSNAMGTVYSGSNCTNKGAARFREFVLLTQDNVSQMTKLSTSGNTTQVALNYRTEPMWSRFSNATNAQLNAGDVSSGFSNMLLNCDSPGSPVPNPPCVVQCTTGNCDPQTPVFTVPAGMPTRLHLLHPGGSSDQQVFTINGHIWQDEPYVKGSTEIGINPDSPWIGSRDLYGTNSAYTLVLPSAGGANKVPGDYLYRTHPANFLIQGLWGIIRVTTPAYSAPASSAGGGK